MPLPWVRLDSSFAAHDKVVTLVHDHGDRGRSALFVYVCSLAYCGQQETDGAVPFAAMPFIHGRRKDGELLVEAGLWKPTPTGYEVVNWMKRQPSADTSTRVRAVRRAAATKGNCVRWHGPDCGCWRGVLDVV